jgi:hypothetical protein
MKPGDYVLGSKQSRVAARHALSQLSEGKFKGILVQFVSSPPSRDGACTCPKPAPGTVAFCHCYSGHQNSQEMKGEEL